MRDLSDTTGPFSYGETSWQDGDSSKAFTRKDIENLIKKANSVSLPRILKYYGIRIDNGNTKIICPFKSHKGGKENTPSFNLYQETNSFYCFGCKIGSQYAHGCEFIAEMDNINRFKAANKILEIFGDDVLEDSENNDLLDSFSVSEKLEIMLDFSSTVREFRTYNSGEESFSFIEKVCAVYDKHNLKHKPNNEALKMLVQELKKRIANYKPV